MQSPASWSHSTESSGYKQILQSYKCCSTISREPDKWTFLSLPIPDSRRKWSCKYPTSGSFFSVATLISAHIQCVGTFSLLLNQKVRYIAVLMVGLSLYSSCDVLLLSLQKELFASTIHSIAFISPCWMHTTLTLLDFFSCREKRRSQQLGSVTCREHWRRQ